MIAYLFLSVAIMAEVFGSSMLRLSYGFKKLLPSLGAVTGLGISFYVLSLALKDIPLGTAYAIWAGVGTALTTLVSIALFKESFHVKKFCGILLIIAGVIIMKLASGSH